MSRAVLSIGSNLGDRLVHLQSAVDGLGAAVRAVSAVYETAPWGPVAQDDYLNAVVVVDDDAAGPVEWLRRAHALERAAGRVRSVRYGPRTLDVDVVSVNDLVTDHPVGTEEPVLVLPHPRAHERAFVLVPWLAVDPGAVLPRRGSVASPVSELVAELAPDELAGVRRRVDLALTLPAPPSATPPPPPATAVANRPAP